MRPAGSWGCAAKVNAAPATATILVLSMNQHSCAGSAAGVTRECALQCCCCSPVLGRAALCQKHTTPLRCPHTKPTVLQARAGAAPCCCASCMLLKIAPCTSSAAAVCKWMASAASTSTAPTAVLCVAVVGGPSKLPAAAAGPQLNTVMHSLTHTAP